MAAFANTNTYIFCLRCCSPFQMSQCVCCYCNSSFFDLRSNAYVAHPLIPLNWMLILYGHCFVCAPGSRRCVEERDLIFMHFRSGTPARRQVTLLDQFACSWIAQKVPPSNVHHRSATFNSAHLCLLLPHLLPTWASNASVCQSWVIDWAHIGLQSGQTIGGVVITPLSSKHLPLASPKT